MLFYFNIYRICLQMERYKSNMNWEYNPHNVHLTIVLWDKYLKLYFNFKCKFISLFSIV